MPDPSLGVQVLLLDSQKQIKNCMQEQLRGTPSDRKSNKIIILRINFALYNLFSISLRLSMIDHNNLKKALAVSVVKRMQNQPAGGASRGTIFMQIIKDLVVIYCGIRRAYMASLIISMIENIHTYF